MTVVVLTIMVKMTECHQPWGGPYRRVQGEVMARLVMRANPAHDPTSETAVAFNNQRDQSVLRAVAVKESLDSYPHDPDHLAAFRVNLKAGP